jgi:arsenite transporter
MAASQAEAVEAAIDHPTSENTDTAPNDAAHMANITDPEKQSGQRAEDDRAEKVSAFKSLGWLDRFLAVWILLAMIVGVLLGNFVPQTGPALQKGKFVGVSVPIGMSAAARERKSERFRSSFTNHEQQLDFWS